MILYLSPDITVRPPRPAGSAPEPPARPSLASPLDVIHTHNESTVAPVVLPRDPSPRWNRRHYRPAPKQPSSAKGNTLLVRAEEQPSSAKVNTLLVRAEVSSEKGKSPAIDPVQDDKPDFKTSAIDRVQDAKQAPTGKPFSSKSKTPALDRAQDAKQAPFGKTVSAKSKTPALDRAQDAKQAPTDKPVSAKSKTPTLDRAQDAEQAPTGKTVSAKGKTPTLDPAQNAEQAPTGKTGSVKGKTPTLDPAQNAEQAPTGKTVSAKSKTPTLDKAVSANGNTPVLDRAQDAEQAPTDNPVSAKSKTPTLDRAQDAEQAPTDNPVSAKSKITSPTCDKSAKVKGNTMLAHAEVEAHESGKLGKTNIIKPGHNTESATTADKALNIQANTTVLDEANDETPASATGKAVSARAKRAEDEQRHEDDKLPTTSDEPEYKADTPELNQPAVRAEANPARSDVAVINIPSRPPSPGFYEPEYGDARFVMNPELQIYENTIPGVHSFLPAIPRGTKPMRRVGPHDAAKRRIRLLTTYIIGPMIIGILVGWLFNRYVVQPGKLSTIIIISVLVRSLNGNKRGHSGLIL